MDETQGVKPEVLKALENRGVETVSTYSRRQAYMAARGYISFDGIVACGQCVEDQRFGAALSVSDRVRWETDDWQRYNPTEGDDWCSVCGSEIPCKWRETELPEVDRHLHRDEG